APLARDRWHAEIRLGKRMFDAIGGLYHSWEHGMRAHTIEHWVTRSPGPARLHNVLLETNASAHRTFRQFRDQFPVWHPGVSHAVAAGRGYVPFNLLDYLGDGDDALAESKWRRLCAAAAEYCRRFAQDIGWKLEDFRIAEAGTAPHPLPHARPRQDGSQSRSPAPAHGFARRRPAAPSQDLQELGDCRAPDAVAAGPGNGFDPA